MRRKQTGHACAVPLLSAAGLTLSLATSAPAAPTEPVGTQNISVQPETWLGEEEISDVSLATFRINDEDGQSSFPRVQLAHAGGCGGCGGGGGGCHAGGCGGGGGCAHPGGCGGGCAHPGGCAAGGCGRPGGCGGWRPPRGAVHG